MALKKSQLYSSLWASCDQLRGGMDASQYKDYILTLLFVKYASDKWAGDPHAEVEVPKSGSFETIVAAKGAADIGERINKVTSALAEANGGALQGVINQADFNDSDKLGKGKDMVDKLTKLVGIFESLDFSANHAGGDDLLGDAYEYLMRNFATESGKSKGQFYTPAEVSRIMAQVIGLRPDLKLKEPTIYDPTCGSGSLLLKAAAMGPSNTAIFGQEMDVATRALAVMNMWLHGHPEAEVRLGNTLSSPQFIDAKSHAIKTFDFAVANPPFSAKAWTNGLNPEQDEFGRFEGYGVPPDKNGDYAFLLHLLKSLKSTGKGAIIMPHGVLFRGNKEADIRKNLLTRGYIKGIIGLPANLFYGTGIPACIIVLDKEGAATRKTVFMVDASHGFVKDGNKNRLREQDLHKIVDVFTGQKEIEGYSRSVPLTEIASAVNDYNLMLPRYIPSIEQEDIQDLDAHLNGGIPNRDLDALAPYWTVCPSLRGQLFKPGRKGYSIAKTEPTEVRAAILANTEFKAFAAKVEAISAAWAGAHLKRLRDVKIGTQPEGVARILGEDLLARFQGLPLLDPYDAYQRFMEYWASTMQDDIVLVAADGWLAAAKPRAPEVDKARAIKETPDLVVAKKKFKMDLVPPDLVAKRFFPEALTNIAKLQASEDEATAALADFIDENSGEDSPISDIVDEDGAVSKAALKTRAHELKSSRGTAADASIVTKALALTEAANAASKAVQAAQSQLDGQVLAQYAALSEGQVKQLVIEDKWMTDVRRRISDEVSAAARSLASRLAELEARYGLRLVDVEDQVAELSAKVAEHLKTMGLKLA